MKNISHLLKKLLFIILLIGAGSVRGEIVMAPLFGDNMVLQREKPVPVWGRAEPGEKITVHFQEQQKQTIADAHGRWLVILEPLQTCSEPVRMRVAGANEIEINNVLVGEVWLCAGQSNMEWPVDWAANAKKEIADAKHPSIRHFTVAKAAAALPCDDVAGDWQSCSPGTAGKFSATAYYFGRELMRTLNVPVGLINCSWGGTQIEPWINPAALQADPAWPAVLQRWQQELKTYATREIEYQNELDRWVRDSAQAAAEARRFDRKKPLAPEGIGSRRQPGALYYGMLKPLIPAALRGIIWYQGESNANRHAEYRTLFATLIRQWREEFCQGDLPFYHVQLPNYKPGKRWGYAWAPMREAQQEALRLPNTGQVVTIDIGDPDDVHPKNKQEVGRRLALHAFSKLYGMSVEYSGPMCSGLKKENGMLRVLFRHATGLHAKNKKMKGFTVAGSDGKYKPATARIEGESVVVYSKEVPDPVAVRYAWENDPDAELFNSDNLPAAPFRTDNWKQ